MQKEAKARLKINEMLKQSGRRLLDEGDLKANVVVESNVKIEDMGTDFEKSKDGFIDYLLTDNDGFPLCVLEAKSEEKDPLVGKEQARKYAQAKNIRFIILSNGNQHYFWDREKGQPTRIVHFPPMTDMIDYKQHTPNIADLVSENLESDYLAKIKRANYATHPDYINPETRKQFCEENKLRFLRTYQVNAIKALQAAVAKGKNRFLFEMATGTGKTLTSAGLINLFLKTGNVKRVLFLVDRIELENQAWKSFKQNLEPDYTTVIYKQNRTDWQQAQIVVSTIQTFAHNDRYKEIFSPYDFGLIIADETHRSINGNNRNVFEYFIGYKLGLTATPKDYLKNLKLDETDAREIERRELLSTYKTFGCEDGNPTYRYSLTDGVSDPEGPYLVNPKAIDCRTEITTQLLSDEGYKVNIINDESTLEQEGNMDQEKIYTARHFEKTFFSENTNRAMMEAFMKNAEKDPITGEIGKTIMFAVSRKHATKITQILNELADKYFPGKYQSDFAVQITSDIPDAQTMTTNFSDDNNKLLGTTRWLSEYQSSRARVCITVGMMTTGYDCKDILNICLCRPIFSPTDFVQIKGRGTRTYTFRHEKKAIEKQSFKLFDFFANCEYFEDKYNYDEVLTLPKISEDKEETPEEPYDADGDVQTKTIRGAFASGEPDRLVEYNEMLVGKGGMRIDRELYADRFEDVVKKSYQKDSRFKEFADALDELQMEIYAKENLLNKPEEYFTIEKLNDCYGVDRMLGLGEIVSKALGNISKFKSRDELVEEEFEVFMKNLDIPEEKKPAVRMIFANYLLDEKFRVAINEKEIGQYAAYPQLFKSMQDAGGELISATANYIKSNVKINIFYPKH